MTALLCPPSFAKFSFAGRLVLVPMNGRRRPAAGDKGAFQYFILSVFGCGSPGRAVGYFPLFSEIGKENGAVARIVSSKMNCGI
ncbi:hypothetical protein GR268_46930 [Rhizobium leguminosarum]|jgi:hypothetical protein|nr:hypothetical protein [Rhizobium leguminosarum]